MNIVKCRLFPTVLAVLAALVSVFVTAATEEAHAVTWPVEINEINFPDDAWRDWVNTNYAHGDGALSEVEAQDVTEVVIIASPKIADLKGIEYFENLTELSCYNNHLTALDLSSNPALTYLNCQNNHLTYLNVSSNLALEHLDCDMNNLTDLDVSNNTALITIYCSDNNIATLDVSNNTALDTLCCSGNGLDALDLSNNTVLAGLRCDNNNLDTLDLSNNPDLTHLRCNNNKLLFVEGMPAGAIGYGLESGNQEITIPVIASLSGGYESTYSSLPPDAAHSLNIFSSGVSYNHATGFFSTDTLDPTDFETSFEGQIYLSGIINFTEVKSFTVTFIDWDRTLLFEQIVVLGGRIVAPPNPERFGYVFTGWDKDFTDIQEDLIIQAMYELVPAEENGTIEDNGTGNGTSVPGKPADDPKPAPSKNKLAPTGDSSSPIAALAAGLLLIAGGALATSAGLAKRKS